MRYRCTRRPTSNLAPHTSIRAYRILLQSALVAAFDGRGGVHGVAHDNVSRLEVGVVAAQCPQLAFSFDRLVGVNVAQSAHGAVLGPVPSATEKTAESILSEGACWVANGRGPFRKAGVIGATSALAQGVFRLAAKYATTNRGRCRFRNSAAYAGAVDEECLARSSVDNSVAVNVEVPDVRDLSAVTPQQEEICSISGVFLTSPSLFGIAYRIRSVGIPYYDFFLTVLGRRRPTRMVDCIHEPRLAKANK